MNFTPADITTAAYIFLIMGGIITLIGGLTVYLHKKSKPKK